MYQNVYYEKDNGIIHCWDDQKGYFTSKYRRYAYYRDGNGAHESIYGERLKKINFWKAEDNLKLYESDVNEVTRFLIDNYGDSDEVSTGHVTMTFDIEVEMNSGLPNTDIADNTITSIAFHDSATNDYSVYVLNEGSEINKTIKGAKVRSFRTEEDMLIAFVNVWEEISPTIITGWNIDFFDVTYLYNRLKKVLGTKQANRLSPIGKVHWNKYRKRYIIAGVSALDYIALYKNFTYTQLPNYRLDSVAQKELGRGKIEYEGNLDQLFRDDIEKFIEYNLVDVELVVDMDKKLQFIDLARAICHAGHVFYEDFLFSSKWLEGAILTFLRRNGRVAPNKPLRRNRNPDGSDGEDKFIGAYVKQPKPGLYKWVYDLDLTSLYPSIIMSINISPETKLGKVKNYTAELHMKGKMDSYSIIDNEGNESNPMPKDKFMEFIKQQKLSVASNGVLYRTDKVGIIPEILNVWFDKRVEYKDQMKKFGKAGNDEKYKFFAQRQLVQKIMLNSLYGVLGLPAFRFYDVDNAEAVTLTGQTVIKTTEMIANQYYSKITGEEKDYNIYVDTDSVFYQAAPLVKVRNPEIDENSDEQMIPAILSVAQEVEGHINKVYDTMALKMFNIHSHRFDIKQETIAKGGFWVSKKRYAQWIINDNTVDCDKLDVKGLDVKRSSFPTYFKEVMGTVLMDILKSTDKNEIDDYILTKKDEMKKTNFIDIAKNSAVKGMSKYLFKNQALGEFQKGTPAHVKAAITYNQLLKYYKVPYKYEPMKDGDKVKWVYLKNNPLGLDSVALTGYNDPKEILDLVKGYIDYDLIWQKELENKLDDFYEAMDWEKPSANMKKASQFFGF
jgi:DNA polymerase elongation subunit (family B)|tara:strand:+ start:495 stop:3011 length:2517 start_codon:yes stop_codon:yes gene_type:complete